MMENVNGKSGEDLIKTGVANHVALQELNPNAISDGVNPRKAFDANGKVHSSVISVAGEEGHHTEVSVEHNGENIAAAGSDPNASEPLTSPDIDVILPGGDSDPGQDRENEEADANGADGAVGRKKKKKRKPKSQRGLKAATGFEEYYVDAPLTPAQHAEEKGLYDISRPFAQRIETAIQRYVAKRNLNSDRKDLLDKYLTFGGIEGGPKMFSGGLDADTLENSNAAGIATLTAKHSLAFDTSDPGNQTYVVDFEECLKAFLSSRLPGTMELIEEAKIRDYVGVLRNFLNYLLHHDVCLEYRDQVAASRKLCDKAQTELIKIAQAQPLLPGTFNRACSEIFGGVFHGVDKAESTWMTAEEREHSVGVSPEDARKVFRIGLAAYATDEQLDKYKLEGKDQSFHIISEQDLGLEVTDITFGHSLPETQSLYNHEQAKSFPILGKLHAKTWHSPSAAEEDLTEEEEAELAAHPTPGKQYEFWAEDYLLDKLFVGMKFEATVKQLSFGIWYFDAVFGVHCSFYTYLPNEMMIGWKKVEKEWLPPRPKEGEGGQEAQSEADGKATDGKATDGADGTLEDTNPRETA